jgi:hypothetical protein
MLFLSLFSFVLLFKYFPYKNTLPGAEIVMHICMGILIVEELIEVNI